MSYGTRIGEFEQVNVTPDFQAEALKATKIGQRSESEKSLIPQESSESRSEDDFSQAVEDLLQEFNEGDMVSGIVRAIEKSGVLIDIGYKSDAFIPNSEFSNDPDILPAQVIKVGDEIKALIEKLESKEGYTLLSRKKAEYEQMWADLAALAKNKTVIQVKVTSRVIGGVVAGYMGIKGFIPASQVLRDGETELSNLINQVLDVTVTQVDRNRRKVVFSRRFSKSRASREEIAKILESLEIGQVRSGKVASIKDFGAFIDLGGIEGLVHISEMSWVRIKHPSEIVTTGDTVDVFVLGVDKETQRISLGMKQLAPDPWVKLTEKFKVGEVVNGTVSRIVTFGAFIKIDENLEGLVHISEVSNKRIQKVEEVLEVGQEIQAKIIKLSPQEQRIGLSLKLSDPQAESEPTAQPEESVVEIPSTEEASLASE